MTVSTPSSTVAIRPSTHLWEQCLTYLRHEISLEQYNMWIRPIHAIESKQKGLLLLVPNRFARDWVNDNFLSRIIKILSEFTDNTPEVTLEIGSRPLASENTIRDHTSQPHKDVTKFTVNQINNLNINFTFDSFVEGKSNQLARAAATQVANSPGQAYNPLLIYGGVGLGKTHLMHAIGNEILTNNPNTKILYLHSERFVADMIRALQRNKMNDFKQYYRSVNVLLLDDSQFLAGKERSQEEFFHTFNALTDAQQQIVLTCDRYPKEINGLEERLQSRFGWGLTIAIEPPELETRVAILITKAKQLNVHLPHEVAFFIAKNIQSNVRELEGALKRVIANAHFMNKMITVDFAKEALKDLLILQAKSISIDNIIKIVAEYYKIKRTDLISKVRRRSIARPRQVAMTLAKELTNHSLPEIGDAFGGRDHTTVLHACKRIKELLISSTEIAEDYKNLSRILTG